VAHTEAVSIAIPDSQSLETVNGYSDNENAAKYDIVNATETFCFEILVHSSSYR
jgi:hypothetical protein